MDGWWLGEAVEWMDGMCGWMMVDGWVVEGVWMEDGRTDGWGRTDDGGGWMEAGWMNGQKGWIVGDVRTLDVDGWMDGSDG